MLISSSSPSSIVHMGWATLFIPANLRTLFLTLNRGISFCNRIVIFQFWKWLTKSISKSLPKWTGVLPELTWGTGRYVGAEAFEGVRAFLLWALHFPSVAVVRRQIVYWAPSSGCHLDAGIKKKISIFWIWCWVWRWYHFLARSSPTCTTNKSSWS